MTKIQIRLKDYLIENNLNYLTPGYIQLVEDARFLDFKVLKNLFYKKDILLFEKTLLSYLYDFSIDIKKREVFNSCVRQKRFKQKSKSFEKKQLNFYLDKKTFNQLQKIKGSKTYQEVIQELLAK